MSFYGSAAEYDAAVWVLTAPLLASRTAKLLHPERRLIDFDVLLEQSRTWSHGEKLLVKAALDMWNGGGEASLGELLSTLDERNLARVVEAVKIRRGLNQEAVAR